MKSSNTKIIIILTTVITFASLTALFGRPDWTQRNHFGHHSWAGKDCDSKNKSDSLSRPYNQLQQENNNQ